MLQRVQSWMMCPSSARGYVWLVSWSAIPVGLSFVAKTFALLILIPVYTVRYRNAGVLSGHDRTAAVAVAAIGESLLFLANVVGIAQPAFVWLYRHLLRGKTLTYCRCHCESRARRRWTCRP